MNCESCLWSNVFLISESSLSSTAVLTSSTGHLTADEILLPLGGNTTGLTGAFIGVVKMSEEKEELRPP